MRKIILITLILSLVGLSTFLWHFKFRHPQSIAISASQDALHYVKKDKLNQPVITPTQQQMLASNYLQNFFAPWHQSNPNTLLPREEYVISFYRNNPTWGENYQKHQPDWIEKITDNMNLDTYPNQNQLAITIHNAALRDLPTSRPAFFNYRIAGEGFPFDNLQLSAIWAGTPLRIYHRSKDGAWYLVASPYVTGWISSKDIAMVNQDFITAWQNHRFVTPTKDEISILDQQHIFRFYSRLGGIYPLSKQTDNGYEILVPIANEQQQAEIGTANISTKDATPFPQQATYKNMALAMNEFLNEPYGWGGYFQYRDCSATMRDLFTRFGIWLPRHSTVQLTREHFISLRNLNNSEKEKYILHNAKPFLTLLGKPGHVMLYLGKEDGQAIVFQSRWGLHSHYPLIGESRAIIGKTVITSMNLGEKKMNVKSILQDTSLMRTLNLDTPAIEVPESTT